MHFRYKTKVISSVAGLLLAAIFMTTTHAGASLHFTDEEIAIWRTRKDTGPYKSDWDSLKTSADAYVASPDARWAGQTTNTCWTTTGQPSRRLDAGMVDAGFAFLVTGNGTYRNVVRQELLKQAGVAGTKFENRTRWCPGTGPYETVGVELTPWLRRLIFAYSYVRDTLTTEEKKTLDTWFKNAGDFAAEFTHVMLKKRFPNRLLGNYTLGTPASWPGQAQGITRYQGDPVHGFHDGWSNIAGSIHAFLAAAGIVTDDPNLQVQAKIGFKEWLKYGVFPDGTVNDQKRWGWNCRDSCGPQMGYHYVGASIGAWASIADHFGRAGDTSLLTYSTSEGMFGTAGGPKSLLKVLQRFAGQTNGNVKDYACSGVNSPVTGCTSDSRRIIDSTGELGLPTGNRVEYVWITPLNIFFKDAAIQQAYNRTIPSSFSTQGCDMLRGEWCTYPRVRFMFGQMEGKVWPYAPKEPKSLPTPKNLRSIAERS